MLIRIVLLCCACYCTQAQETASRSFTKNISAELLIIHTEKASVKITGWEKDYIQVKINFSASHPDKKTATDELAYMQYALVQDGKQVELRNMFKLPANIDHIKSKLAAKMELMIPMKNKVRLTNKYGDVQLNQLSGEISVDLSYADMQLTDLTGALTIHSVYSELRGSGISTSSFQCTDETSTIDLHLMAGNYSFISKHGNINLALKNINALNINANRSDITVHPQNIDACRYKISNTAGKLLLPERYLSRVTKKGNQYAFITSGTSSMPLLAINSNYNSVTIK